MQDNAEMRLKLAEVEAENIQLEKGLREMDACITQLNQNGEEIVVIFLSYSELDILRYYDMERCI